MPQRTSTLRKAMRSPCPNQPTLRKMRTPLRYHARFFLQRWNLRLFSQKHCLCRPMRGHQGPSPTLRILRPDLPSWGHLQGRPLPLSSRSIRLRRSMRRSPNRGQTLRPMQKQLRARMHQGSLQKKTTACHRTSPQSNGAARRSRTIHDGPL